MVIAWFRYTSNIAALDNQRVFVMTEYRELVERKRREQMIEEKAKEWANGISWLLAENGYIKTKFNSGKVKREYHRDFDGYKAGTVIIEAKGNSIETIKNDYSRWTVDNRLGEINEW